MLLIMVSVSICPAIDSLIRGMKTDASVKLLQTCYSIIISFTSLPVSEHPDCSINESSTDRNVDNRLSNTFRVFKELLYSRSVFPAGVFILSITL